MKYLPLFGCLLIIALTSCSSNPPAPKNADGSTIKINFLLDAGWEQIDQNNPNQVDQRNQLASYYEKHMISLLNKSGYESRLIKGEQEHNANSGARLLKVKITNYNPGSAAARMLVGLGAGAAVLDTYADYSEQGQHLMGKDFSIGSGRDWRKIIQKTNILIVREMANYPPR